MNPEELRQRITRVFSRVEPPSKKDIAISSDWDATAITKDFSRLLERPASSEILENHRKSLPALTPRAFIFFLKEYLIYGLDHPDAELTEHLIYRLSSANSDEPYWVERLNLFTDEQKELIASWCEFQLQRIPENEAVLHNHLGTAIRNWRPERRTQG